MSSTAGGMEIATTGSDHKCVAAPQVSNCPPTPPAGPVPMPLPTTGSSNNVQGAEGATTVAGKAVVVKGCATTVDKPGNQQCQATGGDLITHACTATGGFHQVKTGSSRTLVDGKGVACTGDTVAMNLIPQQGGVPQQTGTLVSGGGGGDSAANKEDANEDGKAKAGKAGAPSEAETEGDPVTVATGFVVDDVLDVSLSGVISVEWKRIYSSARSKERRGPFGRGGWTHNLAQWIEEGEAIWRFRAEDGRWIYFDKIGPGESTFHRRERLTLRHRRTGAFEVESAVDKRIRVFARLDGEGSTRAVLRYVRDLWGNRVDLSYEGDHLAKLVDTAGRELRVLHDDDGRVRRVEVWSAGERPALCQWVDYAYHPQGELATATDALGGVLRYEYDAWHRLAKRTLQTGVSFRYTYDPDHGRCVRTVGDGGVYDTELHFDFAKRTTMTSGNQEPRKYTWDAEGFVIREETLGGEQARERTYDADHYVLTEANAAGDKVQLSHDARGNLIQHVDSAGNATTWEVVDDRPVARVDPDGNETVYEHDGHGALVGVTYPTGACFTLDYDARGRLTRVHGDEGLLAAFAYDAQHNLVKETDARGAMTEYAYDALGRPIQRRDALGRVTRVTYDGLGRPITIHRPDGTTTRAAYDARGRVVAFTDAAGNTTRLEYAGLHALVKLIEPTEQEWRFHYDELERLRRIINPRREEYRFHYNGAGRVEEEESFHSRTLRYTYDLAENLSRIDYPDKTFRNLAYDPLGNVVGDASPHGSIAFERDKRGRLRKAVLSEYSGKVVTSFERDAFGRVVRESQGDRAISFAYDARGRCTERTLPNGSTTRYHYDLAGALTGVDHAGHKIAIQRDVLGRDVRRHVYKGGVDILRAYDAMDRLVDQQVTAPAPAGGGAVAVLSRRQLRYDESGRVKRIDDARWGTTTYQYDVLGQLVEAKRGKLREVFDYDVTGGLHNILTSLADVDRVRPFETREGDLLVETPEATYENDGQGRRSKRVDKQTGEATRYLWDCRDRLREVRKGDGTRVLFTYDAFGRRVRKEVVPPERQDVARMVVLAFEKGPEALPPTGVVEYLWDGDALAGELDPVRGPRFFIHEPGTLVPMLQQEQGEVFTYVNDHLGMPKELVDQDGRVAWAAAHSAWGRVVETWRDPQAKQAVNTPFRLVGQYLDDETGLCLTRFRYFDPEVGRWLSPDPLGIFGGKNLFAFDGSPTAMVDPLGLDTRGPTDEQVQHAVKNIMGLTEDQARLIMTKAFDRDSSVVFGGSRVRGNAGPNSDLDVGFGSLSKAQAGKIIKQASDAGPLALEKTQIVPGNGTSNLPTIQSPEEFFSRSGQRSDPGRQGEPFSPSGSLTYNPDGSIADNRNRSPP